MKNLNFGGAITLSTYNGSIMFSLEKCKYSSDLLIDCNTVASFHVEGPGY